MLDYSSLFALSAVVREGSFDRAARSLHVTPSAVSQRIRLLEERVGCALVTRSQPCEATEAGRRLCQHADRVRLLEHELRADMPAVMQGESAHLSLSVAVNADSLATWFVPAVISVTQRAPMLIQLSVDDEEHTAQWLRSGLVLAAVSASEQPALGCSSRPLGCMRYVAAASPAFVQRHFPDGVDATCLKSAPSLRFNANDQLQQRWVQRHCGQPVDLPCHTLPSAHAFVLASLASMGWGMHPLRLIEEHLDSGQLVELVPHHALDVPLYWQQARMASVLLETLSTAVLRAARASLVQANDCR